MIWTSNAKKLLEELERENSLLTLDSLTIQAGELTLVGRGTLRLEKGNFALTARFNPSDMPTAFAQAHFDGMRKPRIYSRDEFWKMEAKTSGGVSFDCEVGPPHRWTDRSDAVTQIHCSIDKLNLSPKLLDATDFGFLEKFRDKINEPGALEEGFSVSLDPPAPTPSKFHAILPSVKCLLAEHFTRIERHNPFLPTTSDEKRDTFVDENDERRIGLVEIDGDLHVYLELPPSTSSEEDEKAVFSALLEAVAFTHGCQPFPSLSEYSRAGRVVSCDIAPITELEIAMFTPLSNRAIHMGVGAQKMLGVAFDFFQQDKAIVRRISKAMWLYRDAASKAVPMPIQVLTACTLFEGLVKYLFDAHALKSPTKKGKPAAIFKANKEAAKALLMAKHSEIVTDEKTESDWSRMAGWLNGCDYVRPKERLMAVADHFDFPWEEDVEQIHEIWNRHRNGLAHGAELKEDFSSISELFQGWSRLSGAIHRFTLAEMGYVGSFSYSPMEPGLVEMDLKAKAEDSTPQEHSENAAPPTPT